MREEVREGGFKGSYLLNLKEQMRMRSLREEKGEKKVRVLLVGSSQLGRMGEEMSRRHGDKVDVIGCVRIEGENAVGKMERAMRTVREKADNVDVIVVGGPANSLVRHGKKGERGFGGERVVKVTKGENGEEWNVTYHMTCLLYTSPSPRDS